MVKRKKSKSNSIGLGISGFTLSIVGLILIFLFPFLGILVTIVGLVFCSVQLRKNKTNLGKWGLGLNILGLVLNAYYSYIVLQTITTFLSQNPGIIG